MTLQALADTCDCWLFNDDGVSTLLLISQLMILKTLNRSAGQIYLGTIHVQQCRQIMKQLSMVGHYLSSIPSIRTDINPLDTDSANTHTFP